MSARIVVNPAHGLADCALDRGHDGGTWLSFRQGPEVVIVKLLTSSREALQLTLAKELGMPAGELMAPDGASAEPSAAESKTTRCEATNAEPAAGEPAPAPGERS